ncbi:MAG: FkbM family methyltransferase [Akkermansiaceae bacterium]|jgi:FkbM family methyltransferase
MDNLKTTDNRQLESLWGTFTPGFLVKSWLKLLHRMPVSSGFRRLSLWMRKPLKVFIDGWVDIEVWGLRLRLRSRGNLSEQRLIYMPQFLDRMEREILAQELQDGGLFLDIGANAGLYSLWVASLRLKKVQVEAFEPDPELCQGLKFNLLTNDLNDVRVNQLALGRQRGQMRMISGSGNKGENRVEADDLAKEEGFDVEMTTLKDFLKKHDITQITAIKIDIEGYEVDVLEPFFSDCPQDMWPRLLICEVVHDTDCKLLQLLERSGYTLAAKERLNSVFKRDVKS